MVIMVIIVILVVIRIDNNSSTSFIMATVSRPPSRRLEGLYIMHASRGAMRLEAQCSNYRYNEKMTSIASFRKK